MRTYSLLFLGFGNVARAFTRLLLAKSEELRTRYHLDWRITGVASRRLGWLAGPDGIAPEALLADLPASLRRCDGIEHWIHTASGDLLFEMTSLNPHTGQPAIEHLRTALTLGLHAITANKGPLVHAFRLLQDLARTNQRRFLFESTVMDGAPVFSLFRETLPAVRLLRFRGILNSTTNFLITEMEAGRSFDEALRAAQRLGISETDPSADIDGWDAAVKVCALVNVLMEVPLKPDEVRREGIRGLAAKEVRLARASGTPFKLLCRAERREEGVVASVRPERIPADDPLAVITGTSSAVHFEMDVLPGLTVVEHNPGPETTAYGLLADFLRAVGAIPGGEVA